MCTLDMVPKKVIISLESQTFAYILWRSDIIKNLFILWSHERMQMKNLLQNKLILNNSFQIK